MMRVIADALCGSASTRVTNCAVGCVYWNRQVNANSLVISVAEKSMAPPRGQAMRPPFVALGLVRSRQPAVSGHIPLFTAARHHSAHWSAPRASAAAVGVSQCLGKRRRGTSNRLSRSPLRRDSIR
jgi:hypothetical protein